MTPQGMMGLWIVGGMVLGIAGGILFGNLLIGVALGVAAGIALGAALSPPAPAERDEAAVDQVPLRLRKP